MTVAAVWWMVIAVVLFVAVLSMIGHITILRDTNKVLLEHLEEQQKENDRMKLSKLGTDEQIIYEKTTLL